MRSMAGLLSLLVGVCSVGAGVTRQEPSKWVVDLKAPLVNQHEETNERGQVLELGEREISFKLTQPADSVVVEVLFSEYAGSGGPTYLRWHGRDGEKEQCSEAIGIPVRRWVFSEVASDSVLRMVWDDVWDEELLREWQVASWGGTVYGAGLTKPSILIANGRWVQIENYPLSCRDWLPDPYRPQEIWGTWRNDERGRVVRGGYYIRVETWGGGEVESAIVEMFGLSGSEDVVRTGKVLESARRGAETAFWGWYSIPGGHWEAAFEEAKRLHNKERAATGQGLE